MPALIGADRNAVHPLLDGGIDNLFGGAIVPQMDDLGAGPLQQAPKDVNGGIVAVEQGGGGDKPHLGLTGLLG